MNNKKLFYFIGVIGLSFFVSCSTTNVLKHSNILSMKSQPINVRYNLKPGTLLENNVTQIKILGIIPDSKYKVENIDFYKNANLKENNSKILDIVKKTYYIMTYGLGYIVEKMFTSKDLTESAKQKALYESFEGNNYDAILSPTFKTKTTNFIFFQTSNAEIRGIGAYIDKVKIDKQFDDGDNDAVIFHDKKQEKSYTTKRRREKFNYKRPTKNAKYYVILDNERYGPYSVKEIKSLLDVEKISRGDYVENIVTGEKFTVYDLLSLLK